MLTLLYRQIAAVLEEAWATEYTYIGIIVDVASIQKLQVYVMLLMYSNTY